MTSRLISVLIPTCGREDYYVDCLKSLRSQTRPPGEVILLDSSPDKATASKAREVYPSVVCHNVPADFYFGSTLNLGIAASSGDFILCLNDDTILDKDFIKEALEGFAQNEKIGMVSGKIMRPDRKTLDSTGLFLTLWRTARERGYGKIDRGQFNQSGFVFGVSGAAAFYRREMLEAVKEGRNYFDPRFRMFYEDLDLAWRAQRAGWKAYYTPLALAYHVRGGTIRNPKGRGKKMARHYIDDTAHKELIKNRYLSIIKNESLSEMLLCLIPVLFYEIVTWTYILFFRPKTAVIFFKKNDTCQKPQRNGFIRHVQKN